MKEFRCDKCDREFGSKEALDMHDKSKHSESYKEPLLSNKRKKKLRNYVILSVIILLVSFLLPSMPKFSMNTFSYSSMDRKIYS